MLYEFKMQKVTCDSYKLCLNSEDMIGDIESAKRHFKKLGWISCGEKHFCPDCFRDMSILTRE